MTVYHFDSTKQVSYNAVIVTMNRHLMHYSKTESNTLLRSILEIILLLDQS